MQVVIDRIFKFCLKIPEYRCDVFEDHHEVLIGLASVQLFGQVVGGLKVTRHALKGDVLFDDVMVDLLEGVTQTSSEDAIESVFAALDVITSEDYIAHLTVVKDRLDVFEVLELRGELSDEAVELGFDGLTVAVNVVKASLGLVVDVDSTVLEVSLEHEDEGFGDTSGSFIDQVYVSETFGRLLELVVRNEVT